jgi:hypothetical protein
MSGYLLPPNDLGGGSQVRRRSEAAQFSFHETSKRDCGAIIQVAPNDLNAYWQAVFVMTDRGDRRGQASQCRHSGPRDLVRIWNLLAIHVELAASAAASDRAGKLWSASADTGRHRPLGTKPAIAPANRRGRGLFGTMRESSWSYFADHWPRGSDR